jgi:hypothetical protein
MQSSGAVGLITIASGHVKADRRNHCGSSCARWSIHHVKKMLIMQKTPFG